MITHRANASLTCGRTTCKKERLYKANDAYKKRVMKDPIKEAYLNFDNKCRSYRKKLSDSPELLEKYNRAFDEHREKIRAVKRGLTVNSTSDDIDNYNQMCFDACQDLQDLSKRLKAKVGQNTKTRRTPYRFRYDVRQYLYYSSFVISRYLPRIKLCSVRHNEINIIHFAYL